MAQESYTLSIKLSKYRASIQSELACALRALADHLTHQVEPKTWNEDVAPLHFSNGGTTLSLLREEKLECK